ncbi:MAG: macro domain-containing protein [bacterium]|nr:macro domain-containing protein [bacterium]
MKAKVNKVTIQLVQGDILDFALSGLITVTDPNLSLHPALLARTGEGVKIEAAQIGWCEVGSAVITSAGLFEGVEKIIHAVGPRWGEGSERGKLANVTWECLLLAEEHGLKALTMPAISSGMLGYPLENCATTMLTKIIDFTFEDLDHIRSITVCLEHDNAYTIFQHELTRQLEELKQTGEGKILV